MSRWDVWAMSAFVALERALGLVGAWRERRAAARERGAREAAEALERAAAFEGGAAVVGEVVRREAPEGAGKDGRRDG